MDNLIPFPGARVASVAADLDALRDLDPLDPTYSEIVLSLRDGGATLAAAALAAHGTAADPDYQDTLEEVLSQTGVRDDRILAILVAGLRRSPGLAAGNLAAYGDPAAIPALSSALDAASAEDPRRPGYPNPDVVELLAALQELGGIPSPAQWVKRAEVERLRSELWESLRDLDDLLGPLP